jgi:hypothetical protein
MRTWIAALLATASCAGGGAEKPSERLGTLGEELGIASWPKSGTIRAGFDLLEELPPGLEEAKLSEDDFEYWSEWAVVTRSVTWRIQGSALRVVCGVGTGSEEQTHRAFLEALSSGPSGCRRADPEAGDLRFLGPDPRLFAAMGRDNVFLLVRQDSEGALDPGALLRAWEGQIGRQPPLLQAIHFVPRILEVKASRPVDQIKKDSKIVFTLRLDGPAGFVPAGIEVLENRTKQSYRLHTDALHLGISANREGSFTICLWTANLRQLAAVEHRRITVR